MRKLEKKLLRAAGPSNLTERTRTASRASLRYVCCADDGIRRLKRGRSFVYVLQSGKRVSSRRELERIAKLALPPAWQDVWICLHPHGHLQATGYDARGRKQYRYAAGWRAARDDVKFHDLVEFACALPSIRRALRRDLASEKLDRQQVLAAAVSLIAQTGVRVGNARYREENGSFGLTTLLDRHARIASGRVELMFRGKGGKPYRATVHDPRLARIVRACRDVPGQRLFQYLHPNGSFQAIDSGDVNAYIQRLGGARFTAKTFRTWIASVLALRELRDVPPAATLSARKRQLNTALSNVAAQLGNTLAICRKSYVHPSVVQRYMDDALPAGLVPKRPGLSVAECDLIALLEGASRQRSAA